MIKVFESYAKEKEILGWLEAHDKEYDIELYKISGDGDINVYGNVDISSSGLPIIPYNFNFVEGDFDCSHNNLISLKNTPSSISGDFLYQCNLNLIKIGGSKIWMGDNVYSDDTPLLMFDEIFSEKEFNLIKDNSDLFDKLDVFSIVNDEPFFSGRAFRRFLTQLNYYTPDYNIGDVYDRVEALNIAADW
jgi:hypothetical protein